MPSGRRIVKFAEMNNDHSHQFNEYIQPSYTDLEDAKQAINGLDNL